MLTSTFTCQLALKGPTTLWERTFCANLRLNRTYRRFVTFIVTWVLSLVYRTRTVYDPKGFSPSRFAGSLRQRPRGGRTHSGRGQTLTHTHKPEPPQTRRFYPVYWIRVSKIIAYAKIRPFLFFVFPTKTDEIPGLKWAPFERQVYLMGRLETRTYVFRTSTLRCMKLYV